MSSQISRRSVVAGIAWAAPAVTAATVAPAIPASPDRCTPNATLSWGGASTTKLANGTVYTIQGTDTVDARVTYVETAEVFAGTNTRGQRYSTAQYQLTVGKVAYGRVADALAPHVNWYDLTTTGGSNDLILNQRGGSGSTTVTVDFFRDPGLKQPGMSMICRFPWMTCRSSARTPDSLPRATGPTSPTRRSGRWWEPPPMDPSRRRGRDGVAPTPVARLAWWQVAGPRGIRGIFRRHTPAPVTTRPAAT